MLPQPQEYSDWREWAFAVLQVLGSGDAEIISGGASGAGLSLIPSGYTPLWLQTGTGDLYSGNVYGTAPVAPDIVFIDTANIADAAIETAKIDVNAVGSLQLANLAVLTAKIADAAIVTAKIGDLQVVTAKIADLAVNNAKIANLAVGTANIMDAAINNAKIGNLAVGTANIIDLSVSTAKIANLAVGAAQIALASITNAQIANATIVTANIGLAQITQAVMANASIGSAQIIDASIATADIGLAQITTALIANLAVGTANIQTAAITNALIAAAAIGTANIQAAAITGALIGNAEIVNAHIHNLTLDTAKLSDSVISDWSTLDASPGTSLVNGAGYNDVSGCTININTVDPLASGIQVVEIVAAVQFTRGTGTTNTAQIRIRKSGGFTYLTGEYIININDPNQVVTAVWVDTAPPLNTTAGYVLQAESTNGDPIVAEVHMTAKLLKK